jgi:predicted DNA-binding transcriptional regulator AlpA
VRSVPSEVQLSELLTTQQVADLLCVSLKTVYNWNYLDVGPPRYCPGGGRLLYFRSEVLAWVLKGEIAIGNDRGAA